MPGLGPSWLQKFTKPSKQSKPSKMKKDDMMPKKPFGKK
jgi:hypothetical protein